MEASALQSYRQHSPRASSIARARRCFDCAPTSSSWRCSGPGNDEAFRVIHDRYRQRLFAYTRQMLAGSRPDAEDALQDVFVRAYRALRADDRPSSSLRAWLYRVAHNRCIDELRRPAPPPPEVLELVRAPADDPIAEAERREDLRRLVADVRRLPEQQRSALLMRELERHDLRRARRRARRHASRRQVAAGPRPDRAGRRRSRRATRRAPRSASELTLAHDRGVRPSGTARRHMRDCSECRHFHGELRGVSRRFAALAPTVGPMGVIAKVLGIGGGGGRRGKQRRDRRRAEPPGPAARLRPWDCSPREPGTSRR